MSRYTDHMGLVITTESAEAAFHYVNGVGLLLRGSRDAIPALLASVAADPALGVAHAALALGQRCWGDPDAGELTARPNRSPTRRTRRERQHIEIVGLFVQGDDDRSGALAADHLRDFPRDALIALLVDAERRLGPCSVVIGRHGRDQPGER